MALLIVVVVGAGALAVVPWLRRTFFPIYLQETGHETTGHRYLYDPQLGWRNIPDWQATTNGKSLNINSKGLRDREYSIEKPAGTQRILVLGDSFAWGYGVSDSEIFTEVLERGLADESPPWEVLNAGVSGWGTDQEYLFLTNEGFDYSPDIVILAYFCVNDVLNNSSAEQYMLHKPVFLNRQLELANVPVPQPGENRPLVLTNDAPMDVTLAIIRRMADECTAQNVRFILMNFGKFLSPDNRRLLDQSKKLAAMAASRPDIDYLDWDAQFDAMGIEARDILVGNDDGHWNAFGHELTGRMLGEFLRDRGLIDEQ